MWASIRKLSVYLSGLGRYLETFRVSPLAFHQHSLIAWDQTRYFVEEL